MQINGLQKLTLTDFPGLTAAIIFSGSCNFRCPFCQNSALVLHPQSEPVIPDEEVLAFLEKRQKMLEGVVFTGGEPMLQKDLAFFIGKVRALGYRIKLDTNGSFPEELQELVHARLVDYVAMDVKNSLDRYGETIGVIGYDTHKIEQSISFLKEGHVDYEFRTTVVKEFHSSSDFQKIAKLISPCRRYFLQTFVDSGDTIQKGLTPPSPSEMDSYIELLKTDIENVAIRNR